MRCENYILVYSGKNKHKGATSGVGLFLHEKYKNNIENIEYHNDKLLTWDLKKDHSTSYRYTPDIGKPDAQVNDFYEQLRPIKKLPDNDCTILMDDFNARVGDGVVDGVKQRHNENISNTREDILVDFCAQNELHINNTFFQHKSSTQIYVL